MPGLTQYGLCFMQWNLWHGGVFSRGFEISQAMALIFLNDETSGVSQLNILPGSLSRVAWLKNPSLSQQEFCQELNVHYLGAQPGV